MNGKLTHLHVMFLALGRGERHGNTIVVNLSDVVDTVNKRSAVHEVRRMFSQSTIIITYFCLF